MGIAAPLGVAASGQPTSYRSWADKATRDWANSVVQGTLSAVGPGKAAAVRGPMNAMVWGSYNTSLATTNGSTSATVGTAGAIAAGVAVDSVNVPRGTTVQSLSGTTATLAFPTITIYGTTQSGVDQIAGLPSTAGLVGSTVSGPGIPAGTIVLSVATAAVAPTVNNQGQPVATGTPGVVVISAAPTSADPSGAQQPFEFALTSNSVTTGTDTAAIFTGAPILVNATMQLEFSVDGGASWLPGNIGGTGTLAQYVVTTPIRVTFGEPEKFVYWRWNCLAYAAVTNVTLNTRISTTGEAATSLSVPSVI